MLADGVPAWIANAGAVLGTGGVELSGGLACSMAVLAYHRKDTRIMWVSIASAGIYAVFVMVGIAQAKNSAAFAGAVIISLVAYLMQGVYQSYSAKLADAEAETNMAVRRMEAERRLTNALTRNAKVSTGGQTAGRKATQFAADAEQIELIRQYWQLHPTASLREVGAAVGCSPMTAGKYKPEDAA